MPVNENEPGYGSSDWEPDAENLSTLNADEISAAFGLPAEDYASYFSSFDGWKGNFANEDYQNTKNSLDNQKGLSDAQFLIKNESLDQQKTYAGEDLGQSLESSIMQLSDVYGDSMAQSIDAQANNLMGGASTRGKRTVGNKMKEAGDNAGSQANQGYGRTLDTLASEGATLSANELFAEDDYTNKLASAATSRDYDIMGEKQAFKKETFGVMSDLAATGVLNDEGYDRNDWINEITKLDDHWNAGDFSDDRYTDEFLEWFRDNQASVDREFLRGSGAEVSVAYDDWKSGNAAGASTTKWTTYCCTASMRTGYMSRYKTAKLKVWHNNQSEIWRLGYDVWGEIIANNLVDKYDWAGECTEKFYQWHCNDKKSIKGLIAILLIKPISYLIGSFKKLIRSNYGN